ncbi:hypothetical protein [Ferrimonas marina]|nr:hypothetical protein [Ferrimonas marina]
MKKLSIVAMALLSGSAVAGSVDVHGDIKVQGQTVINDKGEFVAIPKALPVVEANTNLFACDGKIITTQFNYPGATVLYVEDCSVPGTRVMTAVDTLDSGLVVEQVHTVVAQGNGVATFRIEYSDSAGVTGGYSMVRSEEILSEIGDGVLAVGESVSYHVRTHSSQYQCWGKYAEQGPCNFEDPDPVHSVKTETVLAKHGQSYQVGDHTFDRCFLMRFDSTGVDSRTYARYEVWCEGVGWVDGFEGDFYDFVVTDIQFVDQAPAAFGPASVSEQAVPNENLQITPRYPWIKQERRGG